MSTPCTSPAEAPSRSSRLCPADGPALTDHTGLALVDQTVVPHADGLLPPYPPELIQETLDTYRDSYALVPLDDQALAVDGGRTRVIRSDTIPG